MAFTFVKDDNKEFNDLVKDTSEWVYQLQQSNWQPALIMKKDANQEIELFG